MKKVICAALIFCSSTAFAGGIGLAGVRDFNADKNGIRLSAEMFGVNSSVTHVENAYNRYAVGKDFDVVRFGGFKLQAAPSVAYQDSSKGQDGYGLSVGSKVGYALGKNASVNVGVERFFGQSRIKSHNGTTATVGLNLTF